jgi:hypothetical protein
MSMGTNPPHAFLLYKGVIFHDYRFISAINRDSCAIDSSSYNEFSTKIISRTGLPVGFIKIVQVIYGSIISMVCNHNTTKLGVIT